MKKVSFLMVSMFLFAACGSDGENTDSVREEPTEQETATENEPSQEELNDKLKAEAIEADFVKVNADEVEEDTKLKATGEISFISGEGIRGENFTLTTKESENGYGMYSIINFNTAEPIEIIEGKEVTVYGTYAGRDELGMPKITATIIE